MATFIKTPMMGWDKLNKSVVGVGEYANEKTFDSTLEMSPYAAENIILRITLRMFFRQITPNLITSPMMNVIATRLGVPVPAGSAVGMHPDFNNVPHLIKDWTDAEWSTFIRGVKSQANLWDGKFWLIPPDDFEHFDKAEGSWTAKSGSVKYRRNVKCEFRLEIVPGYAHAQASIDAVNLLGPDNFRADSGTYRSTIATPTPKFGVDWSSVVVNTIQPAAAHEIGHSLGLPHIGVTRNLPHCQLAIMMTKNPFLQSTIPALYKGGSNSDSCYGDGATAGDINNIMGSGASFNEDNAKPWLDRLSAHLNLQQHEMIKMTTSLGKWKVSTTEVKPKLLR